MYKLDFYVYKLIQWVLLIQKTRIDDLVCLVWCLVELRDQFRLQVSHLSQVEHETGILSFKLFFSVLVDLFHSLSLTSFVWSDLSKQTSKASPTSKVIVHHSLEWCTWNPFFSAHCNVILNNRFYQEDTMVSDDHWAIWTPIQWGTQWTAMSV